LDQPTGPKTIDLLLNGNDPFLLSLAKQKKLFVPYDESGWPMEKRVGQHCSVVLEIMNQFSMLDSEKEIIIGNVPRYAEVVEKGVGYFYRDPQKADKKNLYFN
jgi:hypothetical protein